MQNFSASTRSRPITATTTVSSTPSTTDQTPTSTVSTTVGTPETPSYNSNTTFQQREEMSEIKYMMSSMEELRLRNPDDFATVITNSKKILDLVKSNKIQSKDDIAILDNLFSEVERIDIDYLYWCSNKSIKIAALNYKNLHLVHFFIIKKGYQLTNKSIYSNFVNEYLLTLKDVDFLNEDDQKVYLYVTLLQMMIERGGADVNDNANELKNTPLHYAVAFKMLQFIILLLKCKSTKLNEVNVNGYTPLDFAVESLSLGQDREMNAEIVKLLVMYGAKTSYMTDVFEELFGEDKKEEKQEQKPKENAQNNTGTEEEIDTTVPQTTK